MSASTTRVVIALLCAWQFGLTAAMAQSGPEPTAADLPAGATKAVVENSATEVSAPSANDARDGTIKTVQGDVSLLRGDAHITAVVGGPVLSSDRIQTGAHSATAITMMDGTVLSVGSSSLVELKSFQFNSTTEEGNLLVNLVYGTLRMTTGLLAKFKPEQVKVTTPTTVIGVRGTDFIVEERP